MPNAPSLMRVTVPFLAVILGACEARETSNEAVVPPVAVVKDKPSVLPLPAPALDRAALLDAVAQAASAHAAGADDATAQATLDGRRFALKLRFGCAGPATADSADRADSAATADRADSADALRWRSKSDESLEITATPDLSLDAPALAGLDTETVEAVEGFWIARPWLLSDACPAPNRQPAAAGSVSERSVGIAQYYSADESRVGRRSGRSYVSVEPIEPGAALPRDGFFLLLEGRLRPWPDGKVIRCATTAAGARPACVVSIRLDRAAFTRPGDGAVIDEWAP